MPKTTSQCARCVINTERLEDDDISSFCQAAKCAKLTDLFGAGFTSPAAAGAPGDERGGLDNDERVEADMFFSSEAVPLCSCSTLPPAVSAPNAHLLSPSHQAANLE
ncbi:unnamed protein product [Pleuronectes platessa]|uniref:Uncharacterized protein n=1 Tax=Pleuronectes platessa TaxID=8262 RepID=A0A9N7VC64_PLEPL|nr:unnamed protein product [Pleuronectes platessa]